MKKDLPERDPADQESGAAVASNDSISQLGYRLEETGDLDIVRPLLEACGLTPLDALHGDDPGPGTRYLIATTTAGGIAACAGWTRLDEDAMVLHSLAVAPPSRGSSLGASLMAAAMGQEMDREPLEAVYLCTDRARRFFRMFGFREQPAADCPEAVRQHPSFQIAGEGWTAMVRRYGEGHSLDQVAFRLIHNTTPEATLPVGSVFFFSKQGPVLQATYRGGVVTRGHLIGNIEKEAIGFCWHHFVQSGRLMRGDGHIFISTLDDRRRELREQLGGEGEDGAPEGPGELLLREV